MQITTNIKLKNILKVQNLVKKYNWRFEYILKNSDFYRICINSNNNSTQNINQFSNALYSLDNIYTESFRKYSIFKLLKINLRKNIQKVIRNITESEATS